MCLNFGCNLLNTPRFTDVTFCQTDFGMIWAVMLHAFENFHAANDSISQKSGAKYTIVG